MPKKSILVIDDEKDIQKLLQYNLEKEGYQIYQALTGESGFQTAVAKNPDLVILDLMLPGIDGLEVAKLLKSDAKTKMIPILMLTAKSSEVDQVVGLELGASDYIAKPFSVKVLLARVKNIFRSKDIAKAGPSVIQSGPFLIDKDAMSFKIKGHEVALTKLEFSILAFLMQNKGKVFTRDRLLSGAWEGESFVVDRTVDVHIKSIRQKLGKYRDCIQTVRGSGYRFDEKEL